MSTELARFTMSTELARFIELAKLTPSTYVLKMEGYQILQQLEKAIGKIDTDKLTHYKTPSVIRSKVANITDTVHECVICFESCLLSKCCGFNCYCAQHNNYFCMDCVKKLVKSSQYQTHFSKPWLKMKSCPLCRTLIVYILVDYTTDDEILNSLYFHPSLEYLI